MYLHSNYERKQTGKYDFVKMLMNSFQLSKVLDGEYSDVVDETVIIDCRYPYEFSGGHIKVCISGIFCLIFTMLKHRNRHILEVASNLYLLSLPRVSLSSSNINLKTSRLKMKIGQTALLTRGEDLELTASQMTVEQLLLFQRLK